MIDLFREYHAFTDSFLVWAPTSDKFLHMQAGMIIWVLSGLALRRPLWSWWPTAVVVGLACANECADRIATGGWNPYDSWTDLAFTTFWPLTITILARTFPTLRRGSRTIIPVPVPVPPPPRAPQG